MFEYSLSEVKKIVLALKSNSPWRDDSLDDIKKRLKTFLISKQEQRCCYCQRNIKGEFLFVLDIEHILPKSIFNHCIFDLSNLAVACKRCNMYIKKNRIDFFNPTHEKNRQLKHRLFKSELYYFAHPNLDNSKEHLYYIMHDDSRCPLKYMKYYYMTGKGRYTYEYFKLNEFEEYTLNKSQGIEDVINPDDEANLYLAALLDDKFQ